MHSFLELVRRRRSVREYEDRPVEEHVLWEILEAGRLAPSSNNTQPWHFIVTRDKERIHRIAEAVPIGPKRVNAWMASASVIIVVCGIPAFFSHRLGRIIDKDYHRIDAAIAATHMVLAATDKGLGSCFVGWFHRKKIRKICRLPGNMEATLILTLGYPVDAGKDPSSIGGIAARPRKTADRIVSQEAYGESRPGKETSIV